LRLRGYASLSSVAAILRRRQVQVLARPPLGVDCVSKFSQPRTAFAVQLCVDVASPSAGRAAELAHFR
jgi:hypothetical protein